MNDMFEVWSLPWHALQRSLAKGVGSATVASATANLRRSGARMGPQPGSSWLARALDGDAPRALQAPR